MFFSQSSKKGAMAELFVAGDFGGISFGNCFLFYF
jgi:hypothetical protein